MMETGPSAEGLRRDPAMAEAISANLLREETVAVIFIDYPLTENELRVLQARLPEVLAYLGQLPEGMDLHSILTAVREAKVSNVVFEGLRRQFE